MAEAREDSPIEVNRNQSPIFEPTLRKRHAQPKAL
jgi:hypothetical protein